MPERRYTTTPKYICITDPNQLGNYIGDAAVAAVDFETAPDEPYRNEERAALDPHKSHIVGCSFSTAPGEGVYVPVAHKVGINMNTDSFYRFLRWFLTNPAITKIAHNIAFH